MTFLRKSCYFLIHRIYGSRENSRILRQQNALFKSRGLDRELGLDKLDSICKKLFGVGYSEHGGMWSEHLVFMSSISMSEIKVERILEIGTFKGETTRIISHLFPGSEVTSVDLSHDEIGKNGTYSYALQDIKAFVNVEFAGDAKFVEMNSIKLLSSNQTYDLIWVDGYHLAPTVIIDIANSVRMLRQGGIALCDDVYLSKSWIEKDSDLSSMKVLKVLADCGLITQKFIYKRVGKKFNNSVVRSKMLGIAIKN